LKVESYLIDILLKKGIIKDYDLDILLKKGIIKNYDLDILLKKVGLLATRYIWNRAESTTNWQGYNTTLSLEASDKREGNYSVKVVKTSPTAGGWYGMRYIAPSVIDITPYEYFIIWVKIAEGSDKLISYEFFLKDDMDAVIGWHIGYPSMWTKEKVDLNNPDVKSLSVCSNCDAVGSWIGTEVSVDTEDYKEGSGSIKDVVTTPQNDIDYDLYWNSNWNIAWWGKRKIQFWYKNSRPSSAFASVRFYLIDDEGDYRYWNLSFNADEWKHFTIDRNNPDGSSGTLNLASVKPYIRIHTSDTTGWTAHIDYLRAGEFDKTKCKTFHWVVCVDTTSPPDTLKMLADCLLFAKEGYDLDVLLKELDRVVVPSGCVLYLPMDEGVGSKVHDKSYEGNDGIINGASWVDGKYGKALEFDGDDDYVDCGELNPLGQEFTIAFWYYRKGAPSTTYESPFSIDADSWSSVGGLQFWNHLAVRIRNDADDSETSIGFGTLEDNQWYHVVFVWNKPIGKTYVNGEFCGSITWNHDIGWDIFKTYIGRSWTSAKFNGILDEVAVFNRALSEDEIKALYNNRIFSYSLDVLLKKLGVIKTYDIDILLKELGLVESYSIDALLKKLNLTKDYPIDVLLKKLGISEDYLVDIMLKKLGLTRNYSIDALLKKLDISLNYSLDVLVVSAELKNYLVDVLLKKL
ncbi:MAG: LamG domain-containing protein, partial [Candidatus Helarchaeota archaeon]